MSLAIFTATLLAAAAGPGDSLSTPTARNAAHGKMEIHAVRCDGGINVDGALSEAVWQHPHPVTEFIQRDPVEGAEPSQRTEVRVAYDDDALYVGARCFDSAPDSIISRLTRRDVSIPADRFSVYLDPYYDRRSGYYFLVNVAGTLFDGTLSNDGWEDSSWDGVWEAKTRRDDQGYTVEMRIPYSQLRFEKAQSYRWGINFRRVIQRRNEETFFVFQPKNESGFVSRWPSLVGIENIAPGRSVEILPYVTTKAEYLRHSPLDPFNDGSRYVPDGGGDLRMSMGKLTLNATVNPDFGQVEVDPAVVNLSDTESFFQEKRPFFVEGASVFEFGQQGAQNYWGFNWPTTLFFYPRRIGRNPQGSVPGNDYRVTTGTVPIDYSNVPVGTSILGAAKLTGKIAPSVNFGTLHAVTAQEHAELLSGGGRWETEIEPLTYYGVMRGLKEFKDRRQGVGLMGTAAVRRFDERRLESELNRQSFMLGTDGWTFLDKQQMWVVSGWTAMSHVEGTRERIASLQRHSRHYFQRPDQSHMTYDPTRTSLTGFSSRYWLNKQKGRGILNASMGFMSPEFDIADVGFHTRSDFTNAHLGGGYKWTDPTKLYKYREHLVTVFGTGDFGGNLASAGLWTSQFVEFANNYTWQQWSTYNPRATSVRNTRGGPEMVSPPGFEVGTYFDTDGKKKLFYFVETNLYKREFGGENWYVNPGFEWKPISNLTLNIGPQFTKQREEAQYVKTQTDALAAETYGARYVFATLDYQELSANIRLNCAFTPALSLQLFAQPLISSARYHGFKELARGGSYSFNRYGAGSSTYDPVTRQVDPDGAGPAAAFSVGNPDFNTRSLRGNAVLRWEYLPGSTLFLVWTQERTDEQTDEFSVGSDFNRLLKADADNIFLAKVSYYFNL